MKWYQLNKEEVLEAAKQRFANQYVTYDTCDLYLKDLEKGIITFQGMDQLFYVSTHYVYEEKEVKGNKTRYKVAIPLLIVSDDPYRAIYDTASHSYSVYLEDNTYHFILYRDFLEKIIQQYEKKD